jgi:hypothetical protein
MSMYTCTTYTSKSNLSNTEPNDDGYNVSRMEGPVGKRVSRVDGKEERKRTNMTANMSRYPTNMWKAYIMPRGISCEGTNGGMVRMRSLGTSGGTDTTDASNSFS